MPAAASRRADVGPMFLRAVNGRWSAPGGKAASFSSSVVLASNMASMAAKDEIGRPCGGSYIGEVIGARLTRRAALLGAVGAAAGLAWPRAAAAEPSTLTFRDLPKVLDERHHVAAGYTARVLLRWGDPVAEGAPAFDPSAMTAAAQERQFGYNCDFVAFMPLPPGTPNSEHGLLCVNHEYTNPHIMWPGLTRGGHATRTTLAQVAVEMAAHGHSVVEVVKEAGRWRALAGGPYGRRIGLRTPMLVQGPAAGHALLRTSADPTGAIVAGTLNNCSGGVTPWGTVLSAEEGAASYFSGDPGLTPTPALYERYGYAADADAYGWGRYHGRFDLAREPNEAHRFGWVVELDPYDAASTPVKRTALGRFNHEAAAAVLNVDGRVVVYMGDDDAFEYLYRFVSLGRYRPDDRALNRDLLDEGTLSVARLGDDGTLDWLPLAYGLGPLVPDNEFAGQGDVLMKTRLAADLLRPTRMDRPEDVEANPATGRVYAVMTKNKRRAPDEVDAANARPENRYGQILELIPPGLGRDLDHAADRFQWDIFLQAGDPADPQHGARYHPAVRQGWFVTPDNVAFDPRGRLWVATDGANDFGLADGLYGMDTEGPGRALAKCLFAAPVGAEVCGPCFTPDGRTLFLSVQHPGEDSENLESATTLWPDFEEGVPPRPSVVVIEREDGDEIGR